MEKKTVSTIMLTLLLIGMWTLAFNIQQVKAAPTTIHVDDDNTTGPWDGTPEYPYQNITSGLEHAVSGDTIFVYNGTYYENVILDRALNLIGESNIGTTIDAGGSATYAIDIVASYVNTSMFNIRNGAQGRCVRLLSVDVCNVSDNRFSSVYTAVEVYDSDNNTISRNCLEDISGAGIGVSTGHNNTISENFVTRVTCPGPSNGAIMLTGGGNCTGNVISHNNLAYVSEGAAIFLAGFSLMRDNTVSGNNIAACERGIDLTGSMAGSSAYTNIIMDNTITDCHQMSPGEYYGYGIELGRWGPCNENLIIRNNITKCTRHGIDIWEGHGNTIYHNYLADNNVNAADSSGDNDWDDGYPSGGNYWSDCTGLDLYRGPNQDEFGSDGIGDTPHSIPGNVDNYPLMKPYGGDRDIGITDVTTSKTVVGQGYNIEIEVKILNYGVYSEEDFNITVYANTTVIETKQVTLTSRNSTTLTFTWNTTGFAKGNYTISAYAEPVPSETDTADNNCTGGWVMVTWLGDLNGDFVVDEDDLWHFCGAFIDYYKIPKRLDANCDFSNDGKIDEDDLWTFCGAFIDYWKAH